MTDTSPHPDEPVPADDDPAPAVDVARAVVLVLERAGPLPPWRVVTVLARADVEIDPDDLDRLVSDGVITRVQGAGGTELVALPSTVPQHDWRSVAAAMPPSVAVAATLAVLLIVILVVIAVNGPEASWPTIDWGPPPG